MPTTLGTLDVIIWRRRSSGRSIGESVLILATHDEALVTAGRASGLEVIDL